MPLDELGLKGGITIAGNMNCHLAKWRLQLLRYVIISVATIGMFGDVHFTSKTTLRKLSNNGSKVPSFSNKDLLNFNYSKTVF